ncbi:hypothetical protein [Carboxylicivirga sp. RSCT41]|uniref:hypothetical protein n=1 Tax=Carboxylicivirga agarovorans TaxID=3417570 RepID=UPI003D340053
MKTIPQIIGISNSIILSQACLTCAVLIHLSAFFSYPLLITSTAFLVIGLVALNKVRNNSSQDYINLNIEGLPILWLLLSFISTLL